MIKNLLTIAAIASCTIATAQTNRTGILKQEKALSNTQLQKAASVPGCQTLTVIQPTASISLASYNTGTACPTGGYIFGSNCYNDQKIATYFPASYYAGVTNPSITAVTVGFYHKITPSVGTKGTGNVMLNIYAGTAAGGPTGPSVASTAATIPNILAAQTGTSSVVLYTFTFTPASIPTGGFFASLDVPTSTGDTIAIYTQTASSAPAPGNVNGAWNKDAVGWYDATSAFGWDLNHIMLPIVCGSNITTGVSSNSGLNKDVRIIPNPSNGQVNLVASLPKAETLDISVTNALGQKVYSNKVEGISSETVSLDLTNQPNGVYFVAVSNGKDKMIQRLIINK